MYSINRTVLLGNMGKAPEFRAVPSGDKFARFYVCTTERWKDRLTGEAKEHTEWISVQVRDQVTVDYLERFAIKGSRVYVEGVIRTRKVKGNNGVEDRYFTEVDANVVSLEGNMRGADPASRTSNMGHSPEKERPTTSSRTEQTQQAEVPKHGAITSVASHQHRPMQQEPNGFETDDAVKTRPRF